MEEDKIGIRSVHLGTKANIVSAVQKKNWVMRKDLRIKCKLNVSQMSIPDRNW